MTAALSAASSSTTVLQSVPGKGSPMHTRPQSDVTVTPLASTCWHVATSMGMIVLGCPPWKHVVAMIMDKNSRCASTPGQVRRGAIASSDSAASENAG